jgi:Uma2 family endonuclease
MSALPKRHFTPEEYLEMEVKAEYKSQYLAGEIFAMAGAQPWHIVVTGNLITALNLRFRGRACHVYFSDMRLSVRAGGLYTYPDVMALCGKPEFDDAYNPVSLLNPQVIFEVLSPSTEAFDRGDKFTRYRKLDSLTDYVLVSADRMRIEHHALQRSGVWRYEEYEHPSNHLRLASVDCEVPLAEIYDKVELPEPGFGAK